jgi:Flp pilus assembly protein TadD
VELDPRSANARFNLANTLSDQGRLPEAIAQYQQTLELEGPSPDVHAALGLACERLGRFVEAGVQYQAALRLQPNHPAAAAGSARIAVKTRRDEPR